MRQDHFCFYSVLHNLRCFQTVSSCCFDCHLAPSMFSILNWQQQGAVSTATALPLLATMFTLKTMEVPLFKPYFYIIIIISISDSNSRTSSSIDSHSCSKRNSITVECLLNVALWFSLYHVTIKAL